VNLALSTNASLPQMCAAGLGFHDVKEHERVCSIRFAL
jgi:hypothetical protein